MVSMHALTREIERIDNNSYNKNKKNNMKRILKKDAYERYFAYFQTKEKYFRYVNKNDKTYKYIIEKFSKKIITVYEVDFEDELKHYPYITIRQNICTKN